MTELVAKGVAKSYGNRTIFSNLNVTVHGGECLGLVGPNGSGKSTLLKVLGRLIQPDAGSVHLTVDRVIVAEPLSTTGLVAPWYSLYDEFTPLELLALQAHLHGENQLPTEALQTLDRLGIANRSRDVVRSLSSGLRQRVMLALATHRRPRLLLLDEPSTTLDEAGKSLVRAEITRHRQHGGVVILATNDSEERTWCSSLIEMSA